MSNSTRSMFSGFVIVASGLAAAPSLSAEVQYAFAGHITGTNTDTALAGVHVGTPIRASFIVDTQCTRAGIAYSSDPDPILIHVEGYAAVYRDLRAQIGRHRVTSDPGSGNFFADETDRGFLAIGLNAVGTSARYGEWSIFPSDLHHTGTIYQRDVDPNDPLSSILPLFNEPSDVHLVVAGQALGYYELAIEQIRVRVLPGNAHEGEPCP